MKHCPDSTCRKNSPPAHSARPPLNAHLRTRAGHMRGLNTPLSDCRVYSWALLSVTAAKRTPTLKLPGGFMLFRHPPLKFQPSTHASSLGVATPHNMCH